MVWFIFGISLVYHAYIVCSDNEHLESKINYLRRVFHNPYLHWFITKAINEVKNDFNKQIIQPPPHTEPTGKENNNIIMTPMKHDETNDDPTICC